MAGPRFLLSRRGVLAQLTLGAAAWPVAGQELVGGRELIAGRGTPQLTLGPFYPVVRPLEEDADLTTMKGRRGRARGQIIDVAGRVLREDGKPVARALLDVWQANTHGSYQHPADTTGAPVDPAFQGAAILKADSEGRFRFRTVMPAPYLSRAPHIHFDVKGRHRRLMTQMFFPGEPLNEKDRLYTELRNPVLKSRVVATRAPRQAQADAPPLFLWDVVLAGE